MMHIFAKGDIVAKSTKTKVKKGKTTKMATKKTTKSKATTTPKKSVKKLPGFFSFKNKKFIVALAVFLGAAGFGSYQIYKNSAAAAYKGTDTVQGCRNNNVVLRRGSSGSCVRTLQSALNFISYLLPHTNWDGVTVDGQFGPATETAVKGFQTYYRTDPARTYGDHRGHLASDGVVGPQTWIALEFACVRVNYVARPAVCVQRALR